MIVILFGIGLVIGSFLGALSYRLPRRISISEGRSFCPNCKSQINWYDNIPLLSFILLGGKCRNCHHKISYREPLIELATGLVFAFIGFNLLNLFLSAILIAIFIIDLENQIIPDELVFIGLSVLFLFLLNNSEIYNFLLAGFISANLLLMLHLFTKGKGMGLGDVKLAILLGSFVGLKYVLPWLFFSFVTGAIVGILLIITKKAKLKEKIAFGPFLIIGLMLVVVFGNSFIQLIGIY